MLPHISRRNFVKDSVLLTAGADFVLAGMFDWQIAEDVAIARDVLSKVQRPYPWRA